MEWHVVQAHVRRKLRKLSHIWFRLDSIDWEMRVFLVDRYLHVGVLFHWWTFGISLDV